MDVLIRLKTETSQASSKPSFKVPLSLLYIYVLQKKYKAERVQTQGAGSTCGAHVYSVYFISLPQITDNTIVS